MSDKCSFTAMHIEQLKKERDALLNEPIQRHVKDDDRDKIFKDYTLYSNIFIKTKLTGMAITTHLDPNAYIYQQHQDYSRILNLEQERELLIKNAGKQEDINSITTKINNELAKLKTLPSVDEQEYMLIKKPTIVNSEPPLLDIKSIFSSCFSKKSISSRLFINS